jgi:hypothetical protein
MLPNPKICNIELRKILLALFCLIAAFLLVLISAISVNRIQVAATEGFNLTETNSEVDESKDSTVSADKVATKSADYLLPYPGILPDHPLYWLKMVRDRIRLSLTSDPAGKIDLLVLYADKRLGAGRALIEGNKKALGLTTITKAEKYLETAALSLKTLDNNQPAKTALQNKIIASAVKHRQVMELLKPQLPDQSLKSWSDCWEKTNRITANFFQ